MVQNFIIYMQEISYFYFEAPRKVTEWLKIENKIFFFLLPHQSTIDLPWCDSEYHP